jgi:hypothetical protein
MLAHTGIGTVTGTIYIVFIRIELNGVSSHGDWKSWLLYMLTAVDET